MLRLRLGKCRFNLLTFVHPLIGKRLVSLVSPYGPERSEGLNLGGKAFGVSRFSPECQFLKH